MHTLACSKTLWTTKKIWTIFDGAVNQFLFVKNTFDGLTIKKTVNFLYFAILGNSQKAENRNI